MVWRGPHRGPATEKMASKGVPSGTEAYYSFDFANVHFVVLDSQESPRTPAGAMLGWLEADLASTTRHWIVAYWHHPPYSKGSHDSDDPADSGGRLIDMRQYALPILEDHGVDVVFSGEGDVACVFVRDGG